jgi:hypothetical protein
VFFKAGKNRDGYFDADDLLQQVDNAIDIFEGKTNSFATGLFYLIMPQAIRDEHQMLPQHKRCQKIHAQPGGTTRMVSKCERRNLELKAYHRIFTLLKIIQRCQGGSKEWNV